MVERNIVQKKSYLFKLKENSQISKASATHIAYNLFFNRSINHIEIAIYQNTAKRRPKSNLRKSNNIIRS